jgi:hypothetical protein
MSYFIKNHIINKFSDAKPAGAGALAPRPGDYFIADVKFREIGINGLVPIAQVNWKPTEQGFFYLDCVLEIALSGFHAENGQIFSDTEFFALIGKTITINDVRVIYVIGNNKTKPTLNYKCSILETGFPFKTTSQAVLESFFGSATNFNEAYQNFVANAIYDVAAAEEAEAIGDSIIYDDPIFDDSYDGDTDNDDEEGAVLM